MTQFVHNVPPSQRQGATNGSHPAPIDSRHLAAPGVPALAHNVLTGPEFERQARALVALVDMYAANIAASGTAGPGITAEDLKHLPLARLQALALALPVKAAPGGAVGAKPGTLSLFLTHGRRPEVSEKLRQAFARTDAE